MFRVAVLTLVATVLLMAGDGQGQLLGGLRNENENSAEMQELATFAVEELGSEYTLDSLTSAQSQVVSGSLYHLQMTVQKAGPNNTVKTYSCKVKVHVQSWMNYKEVIERSCHLLQGSSGLA